MVRSILIARLEILEGKILAVSVHNKLELLKVENGESIHCVCREEGDDLELHINWARFDLPRVSLLSHDSIFTYVRGTRRILKCYNLF